MSISDIVTALLLLLFGIFLITLSLCYTREIHKKARGSLLISSGTDSIIADILSTIFVSIIFS